MKNPQYGEAWPWTSDMLNWSICNSDEILEKFIKFVIGK